MMHKISSWFFILMMLSGLILIFSPNSIAAPTTFTEYFDTTAVGNQVSNSWLDTEENPDYTTDFHVIDDQGGNNQFQIGKRTTGAIGWFNYTYDPAKQITNHTFNYYGESVGGGAHDVFMYFNDSSGNTIIKLQFNHASGGEYTIYYTSHSLGWTILSNNLFNNNWTQVSWEIVAPTEIRYSTNEDSVLSNGLIDVDYASLNHRITSLYSFSGSVGGTTDGTKLMDNLSIVTDYNTTGNTTINVYNESNPTVAIPDWSLLIYDTNGGIQYSAHNLDNPVSLAHSIYGDGGRYFQVNATNYSTRTYYADIRNGIDYILDVFLPYSGSAKLYYIQILEQTNAPVYNAEIIVTRSINDSIKEMGSGFTNSFGMYPILLLPNNIYFVNISKAGYDPLVFQEILPTADNYGIDNPFIFILSEATITPKPPIFEHEEILFTASRTGNTLSIDYEDLSTQTINTIIYIYSTNYTNSTTFLRASYSNGDVDVLSLSLTVNKFNDQLIVLYFNTSYFTNGSRTITIPGYSKTILSVSTRIDDFLTAIVGYSPFGWTNFLIWLFLVTGCYYSDGKHAGEIILIIGGFFLFMNVVIGFDETLFTIAGGGIPALFILIGILAMWAESKKKVLA